jgi:hypothetical protein
MKYCVVLWSVQQSCVTPWRVLRPTGCGGHPTCPSLSPLPAVQSGWRIRWVGFLKSLCMVVVVIEIVHNCTAGLFWSGRRNALRVGNALPLKNQHAGDGTLGSAIGKIRCAGPFRLLPCQHIM